MLGDASVFFKKKTRKIRDTSYLLGWINLII